MNTVVTRIVLVGARGRMGRLIDALAAPRADVDIVARVGSDASVDVNAIEADVVVDFSSPEGSRHAVDIARRADAALLVGTTGHAAADVRAFTELSQHQAVLIAPNTSPAVTILRRLVAAAAAALPSDFAVEIDDVHHAGKRDRPSGTASALADACRDAGRSVPVEAVTSVRAGDTIGDHEIRFIGPLETLSFGHSAGSRKLFADGAIRAAIWLRDRPRGLWSMDDVVDSSDV